MSMIRLYPSGREVECKDGETVLEALENAGYALPSNCRAGACGECKVKVRAGNYDQGFILNMALSDQERAAGYGLMCMAKPLDDVIEIEWGTDDAQPKLFPPRENVPFVVVDKIHRTPDIVEVHLRPLGKPLRFWPGQFVTIGAPQDGAPWRSYSIANAPRRDGEIVLQVTRVEGGATSRWIHDRLQVGDRVRLNGPYGAFIGDPSADTPVLCLASGSGLAPILSLAEAALSRGFNQPVTIIYSGRTKEDVYCRGLMAYWEAKYRKFRFIETTTRETGDGYHKRIPELLPELFPDLSTYSVYAAGNPDFVEACVAKAKELGAPAERIHTEGYYEQFMPEAPPPSRLMATAG
ncbi:MAG: ferredoxin [Alphaproteobacteria bacterium]|nr:MAG: ferredoxin [Alphaproteobacteria bacterium]